MPHTVIFLSLCHLFPREHMLGLAVCPQITIDPEQRKFSYVVMFNPRRVTVIDELCTLKDLWAILGDPKEACVHTAVRPLVYYFFLLQLSLEPTVQLEKW